MARASRDVEELTQAFGRAIFSRLDSGGPVPWGPAWWQERLLDLTMSDEAVKVQLFRFIDVLPMLRTPEAICRHLGEYGTEEGVRLPPWLRRWGRRLPRSGPMARLLAWLARRQAERLARRFIAGGNLDEALEVIAQLRQRSLAFTIDRLGEATITEAEADLAQADYHHLITGLGPHVNSWPYEPRIDRDDQGPLPRVNISVKLSALYSQFDPIDPTGTSAAVRARLRPLLRAARQQRVFIHIDMEHYAVKDLTLRIFRDLLEEEEFRDWPDVGIAIQTYLRETMTDLEELARWVERRGTPVWVRLVKGAYWDYETVIAAQEGWPVPVFLHKSETDAHYENATRFLLEQRALLRPAFGTHNVRSLAHVLAWAEVLGLPAGSFEFQMLYGMAEPIKEVLVGLGQRVRVYTPYGELLPGMAYLVRRLLENTANESFLRASFAEHVAEERLLMNPSQQSHAATSAPREPLLPAMPPDTCAIFRNEPLADFSRAENRRAMQRALAQVAEQFGRCYPLVIAGRKVETEGVIESVNPSHRRQVVGRCGRATAEHARAAVAAARAAFASWRDTEPRRRAEFLFRAAEVLRRRRFELAAWEVSECGKPWREADADVAESIDYCVYYAQEMLRLAQPRRRDFPGEDNAYFYEPRGVAVVIAPWNFPLAILCGMTTAALVTGNTVIMKPAEQSSVVAAKLMEVFEEVGLPPGVVHYLPGIGEEVGPVLVQHPDVALIAFTGSKAVGLLINRQAAEMVPGQDHVKRVIAEMGGKNAIIVDDDADLDEAVLGIVRSAFGYAGQKCSACSRVVALADIHDALLARLVEATRSLKIAPAEDPSCGLGPLIDDEARQRVLRFAAIGREEGKLAYAADVGPWADEGFFVGPHIFADVAPTAVIAQEEIFGPVLAVLKARDFDHALEIANGTSYALTGGLYSRSPGRIARAKKEFRVGNLYINRKITGALVDRQPFGGFKLSGIGSKAGGPDYLLQFLLPRTVTENTLRRGFAPSPSAQAVAG
ncbi:MAG: L-glutamate gamma-semialdehyde dehydrogenase [Gemmataceae bacterium]|nr:L-glutamate gamma-semialdehyde dehydrogenase [Gemmataceae bacterium]MDW8263976.1 L-glutamate gamma-semialdehyde dehydrogenase [Gemmataceae bacterium]